MTNNDSASRSYGQGAQGDTTPEPRVKASLWTRLRYSIDNSMARPSSFVMYLFFAFVIFANVGVGLKYALYAMPMFVNPDTLPLKPYDFGSYFDWFGSLYSMQPPQNWADRIMFVINWVITISVAASVTAFVVAAINRMFAALRKGKNPVIDNDQTLILGWSNRVFPILKELAVANANVRRASVVIMAPQDRDLMEDEIESRAEGLGKMKVVTRTGDPTNPNDLKRVNIANAKAVIILDSDIDGDATVVSTVLAVKAVNENTALRLVAELDDAHTAEALVTSTKGRVIAVRSQDVIARVTAQASRQPGLAAVCLDLLDFDGDEIYFQAVPALDGKTYGDAVLSFNDASVIGLVHPDGSSELNPKASTKIKPGSKVIAVAEDDDKVIFTGISDAVVARKVLPRKAIARKPENLLFIGWSTMGRAVLTELAAYLPKGSTVHIVAQSKFVAPELMTDLKFGSVKVTHASVSGDIDELIAAASAKRYNEVIVLGYRESISQSEADAQTMLTMLQMNQLFEQSGNGVEPTRLVAEILDSRKAELARVAAVDDLVVSDNLAALMIAQISENPALAPIFEDLFDADGAAINVKSIEHYVPLGKEITFGELVSIASVAHGESTIGYRIAAASRDDASTGIRMNPNKNTVFTPAAGDGLVVIGDVE